MKPTPPRAPLWNKSVRGLRILYDTWYPWDQKKVLRKLRPLKIRKLVNNDIEWCERLYLVNEHHGVPAGNRENFSKYLRSDTCLILILEDSSGRLGTFGIYWYNEVIAYICYLLVDPAAQRQGIGTTAIIACISMMATDRNEKILFLSALETSIRFYRKMGFEVFIGLER